MCLIIYFNELLLLENEQVEAESLQNIEVLYPSHVHSVILDPGMSHQRSEETFNNICNNSKYN